MKIEVAFLAIMIFSISVVFFLIKMYKIIKCFKDSLREWAMIWLNLCIKVCLKTLQEIIIDIKELLNIKLIIKAKRKVYASVYF